jgi:SAGA-associated factor 29
MFQKDTTTFYKAEVSANWRSKDLAIDRGDYVRLSFEGDEMKVMEVERRFVLAEKEK